MKYETEFDWGGTRIFVTTATVEDVRVWLIEPRNGFFDTQTVYGRYDDEVRARGWVCGWCGDAQGCGKRFAFFCKTALAFLLTPINLDCPHLPPPPPPPPARLR